MTILKEKWLSSKKALCDQYRLRSAEDIAREPANLSHRKRGLSAYMNWSDLRTFSDALNMLLPDLVYFPSVYMGGGLNMEEPPNQPIPIHRTLVDCLKDSTHGVLVEISIRWPWPDEVDSDNPDILAGNIYGSTSPWFDPPWRLPTKWNRRRRAGRRASITIHFRGYQRLQEITQWEGKDFWGTKLDESGRRLAERVPESWVFRFGCASFINASYVQEDTDKAFFCELLLDLWRKCSTDLFGLYDAVTGDALKPEHKDYEARYGWNVLKHGISGKRHFLSVTPDRNEDRFYATGPAVKQAKRALLSPDLEPFDAYDFIYPRKRLPLLSGKT